MYNLSQNLLHLIEKSQTSEILVSTVNTEQNQIFSLNGKKIKALNQIKKGRQIFIFEDGSGNYFAIQESENASQQNQRTTLSRHTKPNNLRPQGKGEVAVLYSIYNGNTKEYWVKTNKLDLKVAEIFFRTLPVGLIIYASNASGNITGTITATSTSPETIILENSLISFNESLSAGPGLVNQFSQQWNIKISGTAKINIAVEFDVSETTIDPNFLGGSTFLPRVGVGTGGITEYGFFLDDSSSTGETSFSFNKDVETFELVSPYLNKDKVFIRKAESLNYLFGNDLRSNFLLTGNTTDNVPWNVNETNLKLVSAIQTNYDSESIELVSNGTVFVTMYATGSGLGIVYGENIHVGEKVGHDFSGLPNKAVIYVRTIFGKGSYLGGNLIYTTTSFAGVSGEEIIYGPYKTPINYTEGSSISVKKDWRKELVNFSLEGLTDINSCLRKYITSFQSIIEKNKLYDIALDQVIDSNILQEKLEQSPDTIKATLTTSKLSSGNTCSLFSTKNSFINIPSPGRGKIEGITYLP